MAEPAIQPCKPSTPSRFAIYRQRKQCGGVHIPSRLSSSQLEALQAKPAAERTPAENLALRNQRKNQKRRLKLHLANEEQRVSGGVNAIVTGSDAVWPTIAAAAVAAASIAASTYGQNGKIVHLEQPSPRRSSYVY